MIPLPPPIWILRSCPDTKTHCNPGVVTSIFWSWMNFKVLLILSETQGRSRKSANDCLRRKSAKSGRKKKRWLASDYHSMDEGAEATPSRAWGERAQLRNGKRPWCARISNGTNAAQRRHGILAGTSENCKDLLHQNSAV